MYLVDRGMADNSESETKARSAGDSLFYRVIGMLGNLAGAAWTGERRKADRHIRVMETIPLGARKQLLLVDCDGERFLVGTGADQVQAIVRLGTLASAAETPTVRGNWT
jgi:hypothetical protein